MDIVCLLEGWLYLEVPVSAEAGLRISPRTSRYDFGIFFFRPGAFGFPTRGESSFDVRTIWSSSDFGTFRIFRMMPLNFLNSSVSRNCSGVSGGGSTASAGLTFMRHLHFPGELLVGETATNNLAHRKDEAVTVGHVPIVEAVNFFVEVPEQVEGLDADIGSLQGPLQKTPEILKPVCVDAAVRILNGVVNHLMLKFIKPVVRLQRIAVDARSSFHVLADQLLKLWLAAGTADLSTDRSTALQYCRNDGLTFRPSSVDLLFALVGMHEARLAAD